MTAFFEAFNERDFDRRQQLVAPDCVFHGIGGHGKYESGKHAGPLPDPMTAERHAKVRQEILAAWPDHRWTIEDLIAEDDKVVVRLTGRSTHSGDFMGIAATGKVVIFTAMWTLRIADEKIVEVRREADDLARVLQIGGRILPPENQA